MAVTLKVDHGADAFTFMHQVKRVVDLLKSHGVGDKGIQRISPLCALAT